MGKYAFHRLLMMVGILIGVLTITFALSRVLPGSPIEMMLGQHATPEQIRITKAEFGLDKPIPVQYYQYVKGIFQGDFGISLRTRQPVLNDLLERVTATFELTTLAVILVIGLGIPLGILSAVRQNTLSDHVTRSFSIAGMALPIFLVAMVLQMIFYGWLKWLPLQGRINVEVLLDYPFDRVTGIHLIDTLFAGQWPAFKSALLHLVLPVATLTLASLSIVIRITRNTMVEVLSQDFIQTARAFGLSDRLIYYRYALRATLIPMMTVIGLTYGFMLGGSVVVEYIFDWPGLGGYAVGAIVKNDFPAVMGVTLFLATIYLSINLIVDLLYQVVDPRLRSA
jgi:peptide/nickel transport system permease protein